MILFLTPVFTVEASETKKVKERHKIRQAFWTESNCELEFERTISAGPPFSAS